MVRCLVMVTALWMLFPSVGTASPGEGGAALDRVRMESFISMAESRLSESVGAKNLAAYLDFFREYFSDDAEIWVSRTVTTGYQPAASSILTMDKKQFLQLAGAFVFPRLSTSGDYAIDVKLLRFDPPGEKAFARAVVVIEETMSFKMPIPGGEETVKIKAETECNHEVTLASGADDILIGDTFCRSQMRL